MTPKDWRNYIIRDKLGKRRAKRLARVHQNPGTLDKRKKLHGRP